MTDGNGHAQNAVCFLKGLASWLFWNGAVPLYAIIFSFPVRACIESGSLEPLLSFGSGGRDLGVGIAAVVALIVSAFNLAITLVARLTYWAVSKVTNYAPLSSSAWSIQIVRVLLGGFVAPFAASLLSTVITCEGKVFDVMLRSVPLQALPYSISTLLLTALLLAVAIGLQTAWKTLVKLSKQTD